MFKAAVGCTRLLNIDVRLSLGDQDNVVALQETNEACGNGRERSKCTAESGWPPV